MNSVKKYVSLVVLTMSALGSIGGELVEQLECPEDCDCHYYRVNWVTDCSESNMTSIPFEGLDSRVYTLNMNGNHLKEVPLFPAGLEMRTLQLSYNDIWHIANDSFKTLSYLVDVDLSANNISYVHPEAFASNGGLITIDLSRNPLQVTEGPFLFSKSLLYLSISDCQLTKIPAQFFANTSSINTLDLSRNPLNLVEPSIFDPLSNLEVLKLNDCNVTSISGAAFQNLGHLKTLELARNSLKSDIEWVTILGNLPRLEYLDFRDSGITSLPDEVFSKNQWLRTLILAENELSNMNVGKILGSNLIHLETLDLSYCRLISPLSEDPLTNSTKLKTLLLSGNHLSTPSLKIALAPLSKLQTLYLRDCGLRRLPSLTFNRLTNLQTLDISYNPLIDAFIELLSPLESLLHLDMSYSSLNYIERNTFSKMTSLKKLVLSGNKLEKLESGLFQNLTHLETLELNNCDLKHLQSTVFFENFTYPDLTDLRISGNPLEYSNGSLLPEQLSKLKILDLSKCGLEKLDANAFESAQNLTDLYLSDNKFSFDNESDWFFLRPLNRLNILDLSNNNISLINPKIFLNHLEISTLKLLGNPWKCDCDIVDMWHWASMERGDIGVLVGGTTAAADEYSNGYRKLLCLLDSKTPVKEGKLRKTGRELGNNINRTWARYIREADCPTTYVWKPARVLKRRVRSVLEETVFETSTNIFAAVFVVTCLVATVGCFIKLRAFRKNNAKE